MNIQELATCLLRKAAGQSAAAQQPAPGHGRAVGRPLHARQPRPHLPRPDRSPRSASAKATASARSERYPEFRRDRQRLRLRRRYVRKKGRPVPRARRNDQLRRPLRARRRSALPRARAADDPRRHDRAGYDQGMMRDDNCSLAAAEARATQMIGHGRFWPAIHTLGRL